MRRLLPLLLALSLPLAACSLNEPVTIAQSTAIDEKALYSAEAAFNSVGETYIKASDAGVISGAKKEKAKDLLLQGYAALKIARTAQETGDAPTFQTQVASLVALTAQVKELL